MIIFQHPQYLVFLLALPLIVFFHIISMRTTKKNAIKFANFDAISKISGVEFFSKNLVPLYFYMVIMCLVIFSLSGLSITSLVETNDVPFVISLDVSRSMGADDFSPTRLDAAKEASLNFLDSVPKNTLVGLVTFSSAPYILNRLTDNKDILKDKIKDVQLKDFGGTDVLNSIMAASALMYVEGGGSVILVSDGRVNVNSVEDVVEYSDSNNLIVHTISVGTEEGGKGELGGEYKGSKETLKFIAENTGGEYFDVENKKELGSSFDKILREGRKKYLKDISPHLLIISIISLLLFYIVYHTRYRMLP